MKKRDRAHRCALLKTLFHISQLCFLLWYKYKYTHSKHREANVWMKESCALSHAPAFAVWAYNQTVGKSICSIGVPHSIQFTFVPIHSHIHMWNIPKCLYRSFDCCSLTIVYGAYGDEHMAKTALGYCPYVMPVIFLSSSFPFSVGKNWVYYHHTKWNIDEPFGPSRLRENIYRTNATDNEGMHKEESDKHMQPQKKN